MGTVVTVEVLRTGADAEAALDRAFAWFQEIENCCTRFRDSELTRLTAQPGNPVPVSDVLFEVIRFAVSVAETTDGAFDPTLGSGGWRDIQIDHENKTIVLLRPMALDLGAVAKGLAVDTAARELQPFEDFAIDAGGDLYLGGKNAQGEVWSVGVRHPRRDREVIHTLRVSDQAVCTSGDYERGAHIVDPATGFPAEKIASATVVAPSAMLADALATAAFVKGPEAGIELLSRVGVEGLIFTPDLRRFETTGFCHAA
jgi:thiamine biosynthesis lipoprotein